MSPVEKAAQNYQQIETDRSFREDLEAHLLHGMVLSTPTCFIMCRWVSSQWEPWRMADPLYNPDGVKDCIYVYLASGDMKEFFTLPHNSAKWVAFSRRGRLPRLHSFVNIKQKIQSWEF